MEERLSRAVYAEDDWADLRWGGNVAPGTPIF